MSARTRTLLTATTVMIAIAARIAFCAEYDGTGTVPDRLPTANGFRGIWYANQPSDDEYAFKYSGGMATYPQQHAPIAIYAPAVNKTFFCYGGRYAETNRLLHMLSYFDHQTGKVARPRILLDKRTSDAHDNPTMSIDDDGHIWVFSNSHGAKAPSFIHRSKKPYAIDSFERVRTTNFSYGQPWFVKAHGFVFLHTLYGKGRCLHVSHSADGRTWDVPTLLSCVAQGHYQISAPHDGKIGTAFNYHPAGKGLNWRTNLYYMESSDGGVTWKNVRGQKLSLPLSAVANDALALEYESKKRLVYLKDIQYVTGGRPVVLYLTSGGYESGPKNDPRTLTTAEWTGKEWSVREITNVDNNYDFASLYIESESRWRMIGSIAPGPQAFNTGGEMAIWLSEDAGGSWKLLKQLTHDSQYNHNYPRRPLNANAGFYALWADGHARKVSESRLYFTDREGSHVWMLPEKIDGDADQVEPIVVE